jgi:predicted alpha-1,6-mannanase (GH76 family)
MKRFALIFLTAGFIALVCAAASSAQTGEGSCSREDLAKITDKYFESIQQHKTSGLPVASTAKFTENGILKDPNEPDLNGDATQFKGIFMRHLGFLYAASPKEDYKTFILKNADAIWSFARNETNNEIGSLWYAPPQKTDASCQSSALDAFNAAMIVSDGN